MIDQRFLLKCRHHHPIFLALLLLTIASIPAFSFGVVPVVPFEHLRLFSPYYPDTYNILLARELDHCKTGDVNCNGYSCMRVANNYHETLSVEVKGYLSRIDSGNFCTWRSRHPTHNKLTLKKMNGYQIFDGEIPGDKSVIIGRDGQKYNTKDGKIWMAEDGNYP